MTLFQSLESCAIVDYTMAQRLILAFFLGCSKHPTRYKNTRGNVDSHFLIYDELISDYVFLKILWKYAKFPQETLFNESQISL